MAVHIRLTRGGTKKTPFYRLVVTDSRSPRDGRFLENIGTFDPLRGDGQLKVDLERFNYWTGVGAKASSTVARVIKASQKAALVAAKK